jgi:hypothetical protein
MFEISPEKNWKRITTIVFVFFCLISAGFVLEIIKQILSIEGENIPILDGSIIWVVFLLAWLFCRWRYRLLKNDPVNKLKK